LARSARHALPANTVLCSSSHAKAASQSDMEVHDCSPQTSSCGIRGGCCLRAPAEPPTTSATPCAVVIGSHSFKRHIVSGVSAGAQFAPAAGATPVVHTKGGGTACQSRAASARTLVGHPSPGGLWCGSAAATHPPRAGMVSCNGPVACLSALRCNGQIPKSSRGEPSAPALLSPSPFPKAGICVPTRRGMCQKYAGPDVYVQTVAQSAVTTMPRKRSVGACMFRRSFRRHPSIQPKGKRKSGAVPKQRTPSPGVCVLRNTACMHHRCRPCGVSHVGTSVG
jgi:hypothetical protein